MSTTTYTTDAAIKARVAASLHVATLAPEWDAIVEQANIDASAEIKRVFILKGYTPALIAAADDVAGWATRLGAFFAFVNGSTLASYDLKSVEHLDCRKEFQEASALVIGDKAVAPATGESDVGGVATGTVTAVSDAECEYRRKYGSGCC